MLKEKKYYWLRLKVDFFNQREIKKLRRLAGGDTYTIIYLKMQLLSINHEGIIAFEGTEKNLIEQLALQLDEKEEDIQMTILFLENNNLFSPINDEVFLLDKVPYLIGKEGESAERVRRHRLKIKTQEKKLLEET